MYSNYTGTKYRTKENDEWIANWYGDIPNPASMTPAKNVSVSDARSNKAATEGVLFALIIMLVALWIFAQKGTSLCEKTI
jgi:hypothetical protein